MARKKTRTKKHHELRDLMAFASQRAILKSLNREPLNLKIMTPEEHEKERNSAYKYLIP